MVKQPSIRQGLYDLLSSVEVDTKEGGRQHIQPWLSQKLIIDTIAKGLQEDVHEFVILKCRQVAATTTASIVELFWCLTNPGVQGAIIADRTDNLERLRRIFAALLETLPPEWRSPEHRLVQNNRTGMAFANRSVIDLLAAGSNPDLGASRALNLCHATECAQWRSLAGVESLKASLARVNPSRLYIWESIANGFNWWFNFCMQAKQDRHMRFVFLGFWSNPTYWIDKKDPDYKIYWDGTLSEQEIKDVQYVKQEYNYVIKPEQLAWWRRESEKSPEEYMQRHFPLHEKQCFISSGSSFFPSAKTLALAEQLADGPPYQGYYYQFSQDFLGSSIHQTRDRNEVMLRVWEHPAPAEDKNAMYVIGVDPSGGGGDRANDHALSVWRSYADRLVQCAEFCSNKPYTYQIAWVLAHLCGAYRNHICNLEISGIGAAVMPEVRNLRMLAERGILQAEPGADKILQMIGSVRWFLYSRADSLSGAGNVVNWKTNADNKLMISSEFRDSLTVTPMRVEVRSLHLVEQLQAYIEDEGWLGAGPDTGMGDDLVMSALLAHHAWVKYHRDALVARNLTWDSVNGARPKGDMRNVLSFAFSEKIRAINRKAQTRREAF